MSWKTWTKISAVIIFILTITGFYFNYIQQEEALLTLQNFPTETDLDTLDIEEDITFTFFLYNEGGKTAFVQSILATQTDEDGNTLAQSASIDPQEDFSIEAGESQEITVTLQAPLEETSSNVNIEIYFDETILQSPTIPVLWGNYLE